MGKNKSYNTKVFWSEEDGEWVATFKEYPLLSAFGETPYNALKDASIVLELLLS